MPMPNALVATMIGMSPTMKASCTVRRSSSRNPAWYTPTLRCRAARSSSAISSQPRRVATYRIPAPRSWRRNRPTSRPSTRRRVAHLEVQIGTREPGDEDAGIAQFQQPHDIVAHRRRGRGGQRDRWRVAQSPTELCQSGIVGAKVMAPLADAMSLVDRQQPYRSPTHGLQERRAAEPFGATYTRRYSPAAICTIRWCCSATCSVLLIRVAFTPRACMAST